VKDLARWLLALDPNDVRGIATASDAQLNQFLKVLAQRELLLTEVDRAGVQLNPGDWRQLRAEHDSAVARLEGLLGVSPQLLKDSARPRRARAAGHGARRSVRGPGGHAGQRAVLPGPAVPGRRAAPGQPWSLNEGESRERWKARRPSGPRTRRCGRPHPRV